MRPRFDIAWSYLSTISVINGYEALVWLELSAVEWCRLMRIRSLN